MLRIVIDKLARGDARRLRQREPGSGHDSGCRGRDFRVVHAGSFFSGTGPEIIRPADYERFTGSRIKLTTQQPVNGNRHFEGRLESFRAWAVDPGPERRQKEAPSGRRRCTQAGNRVEECREGKSGAGNLEGDVGRQTSDVGQTLLPVEGFRSLRSEIRGRFIYGK